MLLNTAKFDAIFMKTNLEDMQREIQQLNEGRAGREFELFAMYVFQRAGYEYHDVAPNRGINGIDFEIFLRSDPLLPVALVQAKQPTNSVSLNDIMALGGVVPPHPNVSRILISSNIASPEAKVQAKIYDNFYILDIEYLIRYIRYTRGTRHIDDTRTIIHPKYLFQADNISWRSPSQTTVLTIANDKGGVGKTTSVINISALLADKGKKVLVVDLDAQANLTNQMRLDDINELASTRSTADYFFGKRTLADLIRPTNFKNIWVIPSASNVNLTAKAVQDWTEQFIAFATNLHDSAIAPPSYIAPYFDWIIIDTPTTDEFRIRLALSASHLVMAPAVPSSFAALGLEVLFSSVDSVQGLMGKYVDFWACFLTQCEEVNARTNGLLKGSIDVLRNRDVKLLLTTIPSSQSIETAHLQNKSLFGRKTLSKVARHYKKLVEEDLELYVSTHLK